MKDVSVIIAHRGEPMGLWSTIISCTSDLDKANLDYEFVIFVNGEKDTPSKLKQVNLPIHIDLHSTLEHLSNSKRLGHATILQRNVAAPTARQLASEHASGKYLFFLDNHCIVEPNYFSEALHTLRNEADMVHSVTKFYHGEKLHFHYKIKPYTNFWGESALLPHSIFHEYQMAAGGHGGFAVSASSWSDIGGYWKGFSGYAGEELTTDLQYWMCGRKICMNTKMMHNHWSGKRPYPRHFTDDYYRNLMMSAHIIGGEKYLWKVFAHFHKGNTKATISGEPVKTMYGLLEEAYYQSKEEADRLAKRRLIDLDGLLHFFQESNIAH